MSRRYKLFLFVFTLILIFNFFIRANHILTSSATSSSSVPCIVIDAGHGANDPGKIGVNGALEKDINLSIAKKLKIVLENRGFKVVLTRDSDKILANPSSSNTKREDMKNRVALIEKSNPLFTISIHQNSFSNASVCGPQSFYYSESTEGKNIASFLQQSLNETLSPAAPREIKANSDYYLLKKTPTPTVIVECGFLSNDMEASLLISECYQDKVIRAIYLGICSYLDSISFVI